MGNIWYLYGIIQIGFIIFTMIKPPSLSGDKFSAIEIIKWMPENIGKTIFMIFGITYYIGGLFSVFWPLFLSIFIESIISKLINIPAKVSDVFRIFIIILILIAGSYY